MNAGDAPRRRRAAVEGWSAEDLRRRLGEALRVAARTVRHLAPAGHEAETARGIWAEKVRSETALLLLVSQPACAGDPELAASHRRLAEALLPYARSEQVAALITLEPTVALDHALVHLCLSRLGLGDERFDRLLAAARSSPAAASRERLPHRVLEQAWLRRLGGESPGAVDLRLPARSILAGPLDALSSTPDDVYAFTHALMFASDLGARPARLPRKGAGIAADAEAALARCLDDQDYDLGGEVLLTWPLLRRRWSAPATFGFHCLARVEDEAGFLPAPVLSLDDLAGLSGEERTRRALALSYHTVYVMGLLCSLVLGSAVPPPRAVPRSRRYRCAAGALLEVQDLHTEPRHWHSVLATLDDRQRDALAPLLLTIQLRRAAARRDLADIQRMLRIAARYDLLTAPAARQAIDLLRRAALLSDMGMPA